MVNIQCLGQTELLVVTISITMKIHNFLLHAVEQPADL